MVFVVPRGFQFAAAHCGLKKNPAKEDLTLIVCPEGATAAGVYTQNLVYAAPVALDRERTPGSDMRVVVINSGNANACTGQQGMEDARAMLRLAGKACGCSEDQALVMSTGVIGEFLPMPKIAAGIAQATASLGGDEASFMAAARGILTTDKSHKVASRRLALAAGEITLAGMAKGAGMIGPNMATMLGVVMTDAVLKPDDAQAILAEAVEESFNCISVEGHTSTNDTVLLLASGAAPQRAANEPLSGDDLQLFQRELKELCIELARMIPDDGEGASHLILIEIRGCSNREDARQIAQTVADSALVKTAVAGADPNWGRIVSAAGYAGVLFDPAKLDLTVNGVLLYQQEVPTLFDAAKVSQSIRENRETHILLQLSEGNEAIRFWTSDLTVDYVKFNADYHT